LSCVAYLLSTLPVSDVKLNTGPVRSIASPLFVASGVGAALKVVEFPNPSCTVTEYVTVPSGIFVWSTLPTVGTVYVACVEVNVLELVG
jgi:hypothetical protein